MKTIGTFLTVLLLSTLTGWAQNSGDDALVPKDPKAEAILDKLSAKSKTFQTITADFEYRLENKDAGIDETQKGKVWVKGDKYKFELGGILRVSDGITVWTYMADVEEVQITDAESGEDSEMMKPSALFTIYEKGFNYKYDKQVTVGGQTMDVINLYPVDKNKPYHTVKLYVNTKTGLVDIFQMMGKDGNKYSYTIKNLKSNQPMQDSLFTFDVEQGDLDVIDLR